MALRLAIFLLSAAALAYEILLTRLFAIVQWHHFATLVISLALLGYGASGTFLSLARKFLLRRFGSAFLGGVLGFAVLAPGCFLVAQRLPFNPLEIVWTARQLGQLALLQALLALPFFCAATALGLAFVRFRGEIAEIYRADLLGAGSGCVLVVAALTILPPGDCLLVVSAAALLAAAAASLDRRLRAPRWAGALLGLAGAAIVAWPLAALGGGPQLRPSEYKGLERALRVPGARVVLERSSPLGLISVVESPRVPFRHAPGLSVAFAGELPEQLAVFSDGDGMAAIDRATAGPGGGEYLDYLPTALPYEVLSRPRVALVGAGGGGEVLGALRHGAAGVEVVERDPGRLALVLEDFREFAGDLYRRPGVRLRAADPRGFFAGTGERFDLIQVAYVDSSPGGAAGVYALKESYLYTVESFRTLYGRLAEGGLLAVTRWIELPPRDGLKLFATAVAALEAEGVARPEESLVLVRSWDSLILLVKRGTFSGGEIAAMRRFCEARYFDFGYYPGMAAEEANRFNVLDGPLYFDAATRLLGGGRDELFESYKFDLAPATDDRPYFFHFFKWRSLPELFRLRGQGSPALVEWGYVLLVAALAGAALAGFVLILVPLALRERAAGRRAGRAAPRAGAAAMGAYFLCLGLAFLSIEIAFLQRFVLFLSHPVYAVALVLAGFLVFAGLGSGLSTRWRAAWRRRSGERGGLRISPIDAAALGVAALGLLYLVALPPLLERGMGWGLAAKGAAALALIAPLAFLMGMPFPLGLERVAAVREEWIPWAWGLNGWASVLAALAANLLAIHLGFSAVIAVASALYLGAAAAMRGVRGPP